MERNWFSELFLDLFNIFLFQLYIIVFKHAPWVRLPMVKEIMLVYSLVFFGIFFASLYSPVRKAEAKAKAAKSGVRRKRLDREARPRA